MNKKNTYLNKNSLLTIISCLFFVVPIFLNVQLASALTDEEENFFGQNNNYFYDPSCTEGSSEICGTNENYAGEQVWTDAQLKAVKANKKYYEEAANKYNIPWQILAVIHLRETGLARSNPTDNEQGPYQFYTKNEREACRKLNGADFTSGLSSNENFAKHTECAAMRIAEHYGEGLDLKKDNDLKLMFFKYNGMADVYKQQALDLGFSQEEADRGEGSPYVMNRYDAKREPSSKWGQIMVDKGPIVYPANKQFGAFVLYKAITCDGSSDSGVTEDTEKTTSNDSSSDTSSTDDASDSSCGSAINDTAIKFAWPENEYKKHLDDPNEEYQKALLKNKNAQSTEIMKKGMSCDVFVDTVLNYLGIDNFPSLTVSNILPYLEKHPEIYEEIKNDGKEETLKPGDILIRVNGGSGPNHIRFYVKVDGKGKIASASYGERTGSIGAENDITNKDYRIFRVKASKSGSCKSVDTDNECDDDGSDGALAEGGFKSAKEAQIVIDTYKKTKLTGKAADYNICADHTNCVAFSQWFIQNYTTIERDGRTGSGSGREFVDMLIQDTKGYDLKISNELSVYSIASWNYGEMPDSTDMANGHTGAIVGINGDTIIVAQAGCDHSTGWVKEYKKSAFHGGKYVNVNKYLKKGNSLK